MSLLKIIAIIAVVIAAAMVVIYLCGQFEQTQFISDGANNIVNTVTKAATDNPAVTALAGSGGLAMVSGLVAGKFNSVKQQVTAGATALKSAEETAATKQKELTQQFEEAKTQLTSKTTEIQTQFEEYKAETEPLKNTVTSLEQQVQTVKDENAQFVMSLMSAADGALVVNSVDGKTYSVLKTPPEIKVV